MPYFLGTFLSFPLSLLRLTAEPDHTRRRPDCLSGSTSSWRPKETCSRELYRPPPPTKIRSLEKIVHPRCATSPEAIKRVVGIAVMMLSARLLLAPIPLSNILLAVLIALIALAYLEEDGVVLSIGLLAGFVVLAVDLVVVWEIIDGAKRIGRLW